MSVAAKLAVKQAAKRNQNEENEIQTWIETITDQKFNPLKSYEDNLKNGVLICNVMNKLSPGCIKKVLEKGSDFIVRQNVDNFNKAALQYGVSKEQLFSNADLFEKKNIPKVTDCLLELFRIADARSSR